ncbi:MAG: hypothetical protein GC155_07305 [Alphaproteobacteria bacterium]|nr:hypothetical protein [Alphaproteobacteria bacterium]
MTSLLSLRENYRAWEFGASGDIESAVVRLLGEDPRRAVIHTGARMTMPASRKVATFSFALEDEADIVTAIETCAARWRTGSCAGRHRSFACA